MSETLSVNPTVAEHIRSIREQFPESNWPGFLYHHTDIQNAVSILSCRKLLSRNRAITSGVQIVDSAGKDVIANTPEKFKGYARLYFRPMTPTLYYTEGFRPHGNRDSKFGAHCPVPVYLVFDSALVLSRRGTSFSNMNVASPERSVYQNPQSLSELDFLDIYHNHGFSKEVEEQVKKRIVHARCAEVLVPDELPLQGFLRSIVCRSVGEQETLLNMLSTSQYEEYADLVYVYPRYFYRKWHFVEAVGLQKGSIVFRYSDEPDDGTFIYKYLLRSIERQAEVVKSYPIGRLSLATSLDDYEIRLEIDAYVGRYRDTANPFYAKPM